MFSVNFSVLEMVCSFQEKRGTPLGRASGLKKNAHFASWRIPQSVDVDVDVDVEAGNALTRNYNVRKLIL